MQLSTRTRYAARFMYEIAAVYGIRPLSIREVCERQNLSEKYLSQIVIPLKSNGLILAERGATGGYSLAKRPEKITMCDVLNAMEGPIVLVDCLSKDLPCKQFDLCPTAFVWTGLSEKIEEYLKSITIQDLVDRAKTANSNVFDI